MAEQLLFPQYRRLVDALGLTTDVNLYPGQNPLRGCSVVKPALAIKAQPGPEDVSLSTPLDPWAAFEEFADAQPNRPTLDQFGLPDYQQSE